CCDCEISDEFSLQRIWQDLGPASVQVLHNAVADCPCESSREPFCQASMSGIASSQSFAMKAGGPGFLARQEYRSHLDCFCAEGQGSDYAARICDATGGDHRHSDHVANLRDERERARERIVSGRRNEPRCPPASKPEAAMAFTPAS